MTKQLAILAKKIAAGEPLKGIEILSGHEEARKRGLEMYSEDCYPCDLPALLQMWDSQRRFGSVIVRRSMPDGQQFSVWAKRAAAPQRTKDKIGRTFTQRLSDAGVFDEFIKFCSDPLNQWPQAKTWLENRGLSTTPGSLLEWRKKHNVRANAGFKHMRSKAVPMAVVLERRTA